MTGAGIKVGGHVNVVNAPDIAVLVAKLLGVKFKTPDGVLPVGVIRD